MTVKSFFSKMFTATVIVILAIALCIPMAEEVHAAPKKVKVTFNVNGGKALPKAKRTKSIVVGKKVGTLPKATRTGYTLKGWYTKKSGGKKISKNTQIKKKTTYYARWTAKSYTVRFDANGGTTPTVRSKKVKYNAKYGSLPTTSRVGHDFMGWYTSKTGGKEITANDINSVASNSTLYAQWSAKSYRVTFDANRGDALTFQSKNVEYGSNYGTLPTTSRAGYDFMGWYTAKTGGKEITATDTNLIATNTTLYAQWQRMHPKQHEVRLRSTYLKSASQPITNFYTSFDYVAYYGSRYYDCPPETILTIEAVPDYEFYIYEFEYWNWSEGPLDITTGNVCRFADGYDKFDNPTKIITPRYAGSSLTSFWPVRRRKDLPE